jgi:hypothetical protein
MQVLLDHVYTGEEHTDDYWRVVQLELCSCSCLPAVLVAHAQGSCKTYTQPGTPAMPLADLTPEKTQANNH